MKQKIYKIDECVPKELTESLCKYIDKREHCEYMIKEYTDDWIKAQENIIRVNGIIKKLKGE